MTQTTNNAAAVKHNLDTPAVGSGSGSGNGPKGSPPPVAAGYWEDAFNTHLMKLKPKHRERLRTMTTNITFDQAGLTDSLKSLQVQYEARRGTSFLKKMGMLADHCIRFAKAVDVAVGGGPAAAAWIWGGIRFLLEVSAAAARLHDNIMTMLETLCTYLSLFEKWMALFVAADYPELAESIKNTCFAFVAFLVAGIRYFGRSSFGNLLRVLFVPSLQDTFNNCQSQIKLHTSFVKLQLATAGLQDNQKRNKQITQLLEHTATQQTTAVKVSFPFLFLQNCIRNDQFFDREAVLDQLHAYLTTPQASGTAGGAGSGSSPIPGPGTGMRSVVISGLGGCGKSTVAKEYMYRQRDQYDVVIWLYADSKAKLDSQFIALASRLGMNVPEAQAVGVVSQWIAHLTGTILVVFDNADEPNILTDYWPKASKGSIIITSNDPRNGEEGYAQNGIALREFSDDKGSDFLVSLLGGSSITKKIHTPEEKAATQALARQYGGLPLALRQAASFMRNKGCTPTQFSRMYEKNFAEIDSLQLPNYSKTLVTVWNMSLSTLTEDSRMVLDITSLLDPDSIPKEMFTQTEVAHSSGLFMTDEMKLLDAFEGLTMQSLVEINQAESTLNIHRFFQRATFRRLSKDPQRLRAVISLAAGLVRNFLPQDDFTAVREPSGWNQVQRAANHILSLYERTEGAESEDRANALLDLLAHLINYGYQTGQYRLGESAYQKATSLIEHISNPDHNLLSEMYFHYTRMTTEDGKLEKAVEAIQLSRLHANKAAVYDPAKRKSPLYIRIISNQGVTHTAVKKFAEAEKFHLEAIAACVEHKLEETCSLGNLTQNLGSCYLWWGDLDRAEETLRRALTQPNKNPEGAMYTMGNLLLSLKRYDEALEKHQKVLEIYFKELGPDHLITADSWYKLGCIFSIADFARKDRAEAERCFRQALRITQLPANTGNSVSGVLTARLQWWLAKTLGPQSEESQYLNAAAMRYLEWRFDGELPQGKEPWELFDSLVCYWSR